MRENKRILGFRMLIAFQDTTEFGPFDRSAATRVQARDVDDCSACGMPIFIGEVIVLGTRRELFGVVERWVHEVCPINEGVCQVMDVKTSGRAVSSIGRLRRPTRCADCGERIRQGELSYRELLPVRQSDGSRSQYLCEDCAKGARR